MKCTFCCFRVLREWILTIVSRDDHSRRCLFEKKLITVVEVSGEIWNNEGNGYGRIVYQNELNYKFL